MAKHTKAKKRRLTEKQTSLTIQASSRSGSNAGRGFRYQDAVSAWLAVEIWANRRAPAILIPEGGDDIELRGEETTFIQVKSRREHLGNYSEGEAAGHISDLWKRSFSSSSQPERLSLVLERNVAGLSPLEEPVANRSIQGPLTARLSEINGASDLLPKTSITIATSPQEWAINLISDRLNCSPISAQMCFAELLVRVGALADANGRLNPNDYLGLSISDTETVIHDVLAAVDVDAVESAIREGVCEPVDFVTPLNDPSFYLGVDVEPGHIAAGLVFERPHSRSALIEGLEERRAALVVGPSGAGKSALMWETAHMLRHTVRWFRIRRLDVTSIPALRQLIRTFRASNDSPLGFVMDDVGRNSPESWGAFLKEAMSVPGVILLGSIREEDVTLIAERSRALEVRAEPGDELAERLWRELCDSGQTGWTGWREPWKLSGGLVLEYVHILTRGRRMQDLLSDQVATRISDPDRSLELDILRSGAWAGTANAEIDASRLAYTLRVSEADLSRALQRLIHEHLVRSPTPGTLAGLHQLRSEELLRLTHQMPLPTLETSFQRAVACVSATEIEPLVANALSSQHLPVSAVLDGLILRLDHETDAKALASALRGLGAGRIASGVDEWLETSEARVLPRTQVGTAALLGVAGLDLGSLNIIPAVQAAAAQLTRIKGLPEDDPRRQLIERMASSTLTSLIDEADLSSLDEIFGALIGVPISTSVRDALMRVPASLLNADLHIVESIMGSLAALDRDIAIRWVTEVGQEALFAKIQSETAWAGPVSIENTLDGVIVHCDHWYIADSVQGNPHEAVVGLCNLMMALCPSANIVMSNAITASGALAGLAEMPLATKRIPRENLPPPPIPKWNKQWRDLISRRVAAPSYSDYLSRGVAILERLVPTLEKVFDGYFRGKNTLSSLYETLNYLNAETEALTPPAISSLEAAGNGSNEANTAVTKFQNLLHSATVNLIKRFAILPEQAGAYIAWLSELITDVDVAIAEEPWQLIADSPPLSLTRLQALLETLRMLAGEAYERKESPFTTWRVRGKGAQLGNAFRRVGLSAKTAGNTRLARRKAEIEQAAKDAGVEASFHIRINRKGIIPWPPVDILALQPATDLTYAVNMLVQQLDQLRSVVDLQIHLTVMPVIDGVVVPALAKSGHQTLLPDIAGATVWAEYLKLPFAPSLIASLFGEVLSLASELGAMYRIGLGTETRPKEEVIALQRLESSYIDKRGELIRQLDTFDLEIQTDVSALIESLRTGHVDFAAEAQAALSGVSSDILEATGYLTLILIESELQPK